MLSRRVEVSHERWQHSICSERNDASQSHGFECSTTTALLCRLFYEVLCAVYWRAGAKIYPRVDLASVFLYYRFDSSFAKLTLSREFMVEVGWSETVCVVGNIVRVISVYVLRSTQIMQYMSGACQLTEVAPCNLRVDLGSPLFT